MDPVTPNSKRACPFSNPHQYRENKDRLFRAIGFTGTLIGGCLTAAFVFPPAAPIALTAAAVLTVALVVEGLALAYLSSQKNRPPKEAGSVSKLEEVNLTSSPSTDGTSELEMDPIDIDEWGEDMMSSNPNLASREQEIMEWTPRMFSGERMLEGGYIDPLIQALSGSEVIEFVVIRQGTELRFYYQNGELIATNPDKDSDIVKQRRLTIAPIDIRGAGPFQWLWSRINLRNEPQYGEDHCAALFIRYDEEGNPLPTAIEYFDPKHTKLHEKLQDKYSDKPVLDRISELCQDRGVNSDQVSQYGFRGREGELQVQRFTDWTTCGVQVCRRAEQHIQRRDSKALPVWDKQSSMYQSKAMTFARKVMQVRLREMRPTPSSETDNI